MESSCFTHQQDQVSMTSGPYSQMMGSSTAGTNRFGDSNTASGAIAPAPAPGFAFE